MTANIGPESADCKRLAAATLEADASKPQNNPMDQVIFFSIQHVGIEQP
jgi:hypothetical protein